MKPKPESNLINIIINSGCVVQVEGLPEDWEYAITDLDDNPDAWEESERVWFVAHFRGKYG